jgi:hypothetical protein
MNSLLSSYTLWARKRLTEKLKTGFSIAERLSRESSITLFPFSCVSRINISSLQTQNTPTNRFQKIPNFHRFSVNVWVPCASKCSGTSSRSLLQSERRTLSECAWSCWLQHAVHILCFSNMLDIHGHVFFLSKPSFILWGPENGYNHWNLGLSIH